MTRIPLLVPRMPVAERLLPYLQQIDQNRWYTNFGPLNEELEARILIDCGGRLQRRNVTTVSNCTVGLELALQAHGLLRGSRVLIPAITFVATATAVLRVGMIPVLSDIDPDTWVLTPAIAKAAAARMKIDAVMPVSTFGYAHDPCSWDDFARDTGLPVIIDAAGAFGNQHYGELFDVVYSFHATKSFGAAEGGAVLSPSAQRIEKIRRLANFGIDVSTGLLSELGTNGKMSEYHCAIGLASFDEWDETKTARRHLMKKYMAVLQEHCPSLTFQKKDPDGIYPLMSVAIPPLADIHKVQELLASNSIETRRWYSPSLNMHPALASLEHASSLEHADCLGNRILGLPFFTTIEDEAIQHVCRTLAVALEVD